MDDGYDDGSDGKLLDGAAALPVIGDEGQAAGGVVAAVLPEEAPIGQVALQPERACVCVRHPIHQRLHSPGLSVIGVVVVRIVIGIAGAKSRPVIGVVIGIVIVRVVIGVVIRVGIVRVGANSRPVIGVVNGVIVIGVVIGVIVRVTVVGGGVARVRHWPGVRIVVVGHGIHVVGVGVRLVVGVVSAIGSDPVAGGRRVVRHISASRGAGPEFLGVQGQAAADDDQQHDCEFAHLQIIWILGISKLISPGASLCIPQSNDFWCIVLFYSEPMVGVDGKMEN